MKNLFLAAAATMVVAAYQNNAHADDSIFYVVTNKQDENSIVGYAEGRGGKYESMGEFGTGGKGTGDLEIPALQKDPTHPLANGDDPLISANALALTDDKKHIVVVNAGDASLSLMKVNEDRSLTAVNTAPSSDKFPVSVAIFGDMVVAASVGDNNGAGSIGAFTINGGNITAVAGSRRDLAARPSTIAFSSDGEHVIVDELVTGKIKVFEVMNGSFSEDPVSVIDSPRGRADRFQAIPVGFAVRGDGGDDVLIVSEARFLTPEFGLREGDGSVAQSPLYSWQTGSISTYLLTDDGALSLLSGDVLTGDDFEGGEIANCWVALTHDGKYVYAANALSSSISRFKLDRQGHAFLDKVTAYKDESQELFFGDQAISRDGDKLFQLVGNKGEVIIFDIRNDGTLKKRQSIGGLPELGAFGMLTF